MENSWAGFYHLNQLITDSLEKLNAPGIALGITDREKLIHLGLYGFANRETRRPLQADLLFEIGSISKSFAAIAILQQWEVGRVDLHVPIQEYLPWFEIHSSFEPFTLHHLLSHTAGIAAGGEFHLSPAGNVWEMRKQETSAPPGVSFHYSNDGYKIIGLVLESILGQPIQDILEDRILAPLGMNASSASIQHRSRQRMATGYDALYDDRPLRPGGELAPAVWLEGNSADGSIISTAEDMCKYIRVLLQEGKGLLSADGFEHLTCPVIAPDDGSHGKQYAYGLNVSRTNGSLTLSHSGGMVGYTAYLLADLGAGLGVIVLANGPSRPDLVGKSALAYVQAGLSGNMPPSPDIIEAISTIEDACAYEGVYRGGERIFHVHAREERLWIQFDGDPMPLERLEGDHFYAVDSDFVLFPLTFERVKDEIVSVGYGGSWYARDSKPVWQEFSTPKSWEAYCGHYRAHNPWYSNFRIVIRRDRLLIIDQLDYERSLIPIGEHSFRIGDDLHSPEKICFEVFIDGLAMQARTVGGVYCRTFTP